MEVLRDTDIKLSGPLDLKISSACKKRRVGYLSDMPENHQSSLVTSIACHLHQILVGEKAILSALTSLQSSS